MAVVSCCRRRQSSVKRAASGAGGCHFEHQVVGGEGGCILRLFKSKRISRRRAQAVGVHVFINARTDIFLKARAEDHDKAKVDAAMNARTPMPTRAPAGSSRRGWPSQRWSSG